MERRKGRVSKEFLEEILEKIRVRHAKRREYSTASKWYNSRDVTQIEYIYGVN